MSVKYNDDYRHNTPWWEVSLAALVREHEDGGLESEEDCCNRLMADAGLYGADPLQLLIAREEASDNEHP